MLHRAQDLGREKVLYILNRSRVEVLKEKVMELVEVDEERLVERHELSSANNHLKCSHVRDQRRDR